MSSIHPHIFQTKGENKRRQKSPWRPPCFPLLALPGSVHTACARTPRISVTSAPNHAAARLPHAIIADTRHTPALLHSASTCTRPRMSRCALPTRLPRTLLHVHCTGTDNWIHCACDEVHRYRMHNNRLRRHSLRTSSFPSVCSGANVCDCSFIRTGAIFVWNGAMEIPRTTRSILVADGLQREEV